MLRRLRACDVPCAPVNDYAAVAADPQVQLNALLACVDHPKLGRVPFIRNPLKVQGMNPAAGHAPLLGEHTDSILLAAGWPAGKIGELHKAAAIK